jgi:hypothetical protein
LYTGTAETLSETSQQSRIYEPGLTGAHSRRGSEEGEDGLEEHVDENWPKELGGSKKS